MVIVWPLRSSVAPEVTVTALIGSVPKAPAEPSFKIPVETVRAPVKVLAPERVRTLVPTLDQPRARVAPSEMLPASVMSP